MGTTGVPGDRSRQLRTFMARDSLQMNVGFQKFRVNGDIKPPLLLSELCANSTYLAPGMGTGDGAGGTVCIHEEHTNVRELRCRILKSQWGWYHEAPAEGLSYNPALFCSWSMACLCVRGRARAWLHGLLLFGYCYPA